MLSPRLRLALWCLERSDQAYKRGRGYLKKTEALSSPIYYHLTNIQIFWARFWSTLARRLLDNYPLT